MSLADYVYSALFFPEMLTIPGYFLRLKAFGDRELKKYLLFFFFFLWRLLCGFLLSWTQ